MRQEASVHAILSDIGGKPSGIDIVIQGEQISPLAMNLLTDRINRAVHDTFPSCVVEHVRTTQLRTIQEEAHVPQT